MWCFTARWHRCIRSRVGSLVRPAGTVTTIFSGRLASVTGISIKSRRNSNLVIAHFRRILSSYVSYRHLRQQTHNPAYQERRYHFSQRSLMPRRTAGWWAEPQKPEDYQYQRIGISGNNSDRMIGRNLQANRRISWRSTVCPLLHDSLLCALQS